MAVAVLKNETFDTARLYAKTETGEFIVPDHHIFRLRLGGVDAFDGKFGNDVLRFGLCTPAPISAG